MLGWRRPLIVLAASSIFLWLGATPVLGAGNPDRQPAGTPPDVVAPLCGAALGDVLAHISINRQFQKTYVSADGTVRLTFQGYVEASSRPWQRVRASPSMEAVPPRWSSFRTATPSSSWRDTRSS